jgi:predicted DsbA family dithiol-disulfide isomerase
MNVDIWSDIRCPFCYIGKRKYELALGQFSQKNMVSTHWHSFELDPSFVTDSSLNVYDYLSKSKGRSREWAVQMHQQVKQSAKQIGLDFNFEKVIMANSFNAQRLVQLAKTKKLDRVAAEDLFRAHFAEGKNIDDLPTLVEIGTGFGLYAHEISEMLNSGNYIDAVRNDEDLASSMGISGVPFFVLNNKYAISGAQAPEIFLQSLQYAWSEYEKEIPQLISVPAIGIPTG